MVVVPVQTVLITLVKTQTNMVPTRILKRCAHVLALVLHMLIVGFFTFAECLVLWMIHWVVPLYKRKCVYEAANYKGIHLRLHISKVLKRIRGIIRCTANIHWIFLPESVCSYVTKRRTIRFGISSAYVNKCIWQNAESCCILFRCVRGL